VVFVMYMDGAAYPTPAQEDWTATVATLDIQHDTLVPLTSFTVLPRPNVHGLLARQHLHWFLRWLNSKTQVSRDGSCGLDITALLKSSRQVTLVSRTIRENSKWRECQRSMSPWRWPAARAYSMALPRRTPSAPHAIHLKTSEALRTPPSTRSVNSSDAWARAAGKTCSGAGESWKTRPPWLDITAPW